MNKRIDEWWKLIVLIICASIFSTIVLNLILSVDISDTFRIADNSWVGFWGSLMGSIIGGCITLIGIKITIEQNKEDEEENKRFSVAPYLALDINVINKNEIECMKFDAPGFPIRMERMNFININYNYLAVDLNVVDNEIPIMYFSYNTCDRLESEVEPLIYMMTIENNGLNNAVYMYIDNIVFTDDVNGQSIDIIDQKSQFTFKDKCICTGLKVGDKFGIALSLTFNADDVEKTLHLTIRYNDLLGNTYRQNIKIRIQVYNLSTSRDGRIIIDSIEYPDGRIVKLN